MVYAIKLMDYDKIHFSLLAHLNMDDEVIQYVCALNAVRLSGNSWEWDYARYYGPDELPESIMFLMHKDLEAKYADMSFDERYGGSNDGYI